LLGGVPEAAAMWMEVEHYKIVGACLAAARRRVNVTQDQLAARLGKPQSFVSEYERGQRRIDVVEFLVISRTLGVDALDLFAEIAKSVKPSHGTTPSA
jgi:transcriptional regulator with XRE-family HTH domain